MTKLPDPTELNRRPTKFELVLDLVKERMLTIVVLIIAIMVFIGFMNWDISVPRFWKIAFIAALITLPYGKYVGEYVKNLLFEPFYVYVVDLDARITDAALYQFPFNDFMKLESENGEIDQVTPNLAFAKNVDKEELKCHGTWRGTLSDRVLLRQLEKIDECRTMLENDAKEGFAVKTKSRSIIRDATFDATMSVIKLFDAGTLPDEGKGIDDAVEKAIEKYDLDELIEDRDELADLEYTDNIENGAGVRGDRDEKPPGGRENVETIASEVDDD